jgi:hypothetical protein
MMAPICARAQAPQRAADPRDHLRGPAVQTDAALRRFRPATVVTLRRFADCFIAVILS